MENKQVSESDIAEFIILLLSELCSIPKEKILRTSRLEEDLDLEGDDFSFIFIPKVEMKYGIIFSGWDFEDAACVQDCINIIKNRIATSSTEESNLNFPIWVWAIYRSLPAFLRKKKNAD